MHILEYETYILLTLHAFKVEASLSARLKHSRASWSQHGIQSVLKAMILCKVIAQTVEGSKLLKHVRAEEKGFKIGRLPSKLESLQ